MAGKKLWHSKTIWFNVLTGALAVAQALGVAGMIPGEYLALAMAIGNAMLRTITEEPIVR